MFKLSRVVKTRADLVLLHPVKSVLEHRCSDPKDGDLCLG